MSKRWGTWSWQWCFYQRSVGLHFILPNLRVLSRVEELHPHYVAANYFRAYF